MGNATRGAVGIVLSGGGSRGIAHIGVLRALGEHGVRPDCIAATSAGAIVGALYAAGYSPAEMLKFFETKHPYQLSKLAIAKPGFIDTTKVVADFEEYFPDNAFEALDLDLRVVATDILSGREVVFDAGPLIPAVLASSSVPLVFTPTEIDGQAYSDGAIVNNFPVELLEQHCQVILGSYVSPLREIVPSELTSSLAVLKRALEIGIFQASQAKFARCDVVLCPESLSRFGPFETKNLAAIEAVGYEATLQRMAAIERAVGDLGE